MLNRSFYFILTLLVGLLASTGCYKEEILRPSQTRLLELMQQDPELQLFSQALGKLNLARLQRSDRVTLFAPTDAAMRTYMQEKGYTTLEEIPLADLNSLVLNHILDGDFGPSALPIGYTQSLAESPVSGVGIPISLFLNKEDQKVFVNGVEVNKEANWAENGVFYKINNVIPLPDALTHIALNPDFSSFCKLLQRSDLEQSYVTLLGKLVNATVFVPNNSAFAIFLVEQRVSTLDEVSSEKVNALLKNYVCMNAQILSKEVRTNTTAKNMIGTALKIERTGDLLQLVDEKNRKATLTTLDVKGTNAVVHAVNRIFLPL